MAREEQRREGQHRGGERPCVCLSTCVCQNRSSCVDTDGFRGKKIKGGVAVCAFSGPAAPASCLL